MRFYKSIKEISSWWYYKILNSRLNKMFKYSFAENEEKKGNLLSVDECNAYIYNKIISGEPFAAVRFGSNEAVCISYVIGKNIKAIRNMNKQNLINMENCAGFFPSNLENAEKFTAIMHEAYMKSDIIGIWDMGMQDFITSYWYNPRILKTKLKNLEPFVNYNNPWSKALKGKKVLVIHPFVKSISDQYEYRDKLFPNSEILPLFELKLLKAVQTAAGEKDNRFKDWFEALNWMYNKALEIEFDIAIIGCGAYGFPLATMLKDAGKQAIHLGSMVQILFGIKGKRWDVFEIMKYVKDLYNDYWKYPDESETPQNAASVEAGIYWKPEQ